MNNNRLIYAVGQIDGRYIEEAAPGEKRKISSVRKRWAVAAACACLAVGAVFAAARIATRPAIVLSDGTTAKVSFAGNAGTGIYGGTVVDGALAYLTEKEMFSADGVEIYRGKVSGVESYSIDFNGETVLRSVVTVKVEKCLKGDAETGESVRVLLPGIVAENGVASEDTEVSALIEEGNELIVMPRVCPAGSVWTFNGASLVISDLATHTLPDGVRWVFLETEDGLIFDRDAYPGAADAASLDDVENYVADMLK